MAMTTHPIVANALDAIRVFCKRWNITEVALFGSVLREDFRDDSDIDLLVQFAAGTRYTLFVRFGTDGR